LTAVRFSAIRKSFDGTEVLCGIDLDIAEGELLVLLGRSGCGKSTLLRILAGLEEPTSGDVFIDGRRVNDVEPGLRGVSMVFQSYALFPHLTVEENIGFPLAVRRAPREEIRARVERAARMLGIEHLFGRFPRQLSGGERQRVAIGRAIVREPKITLFDEPLSNLDAGLRARMRVELKALHERLKNTMIYVTHDQVEAMTLADRIVLLEGGRIRQAAPPMEIYGRPADIFVARFLGQPPMNLIEGELRAGAFFGGPLEIPLDSTTCLPEGRATAGIRPEEIEVFWEKTGAPAGAFSARIELVEPVGDRGHLHLRLGELSIVATVEGSRAFRAKPGESVAIVFAEKALHFFGADGKRIR
jgi:ABC-type sugar transport system ATPase subunit